MTFWMPKPGMMAAGGGGALAFVNASAPLYEAAGNSGTNFPAAVAPVSGNLAISFAGIKRTTTWYDSFRDMLLGDTSGFPYDKPVQTGGISPFTIYNSSVCDQPMFRVLDGTDAGADLSWSLPSAKINMAAVTLQFSGCRESAPFVDGRIVGTDTSQQIPPTNNQWRYNAAASATLTAKDIKVSGAGRLAVMIVVIGGTGFNNTVTPPAGWDLVNVRSVSSGADSFAGHVFTKLIDAHEVGETWTIGASYANWGVYGFALLPKGETPTMKVMMNRNTIEDMPWSGGIVCSTHGTTNNYSQFQQLPEASNRKVYYEAQCFYMGIPEDTGLSFTINNTTTQAPNTFSGLPGNTTITPVDGVTWRFNGAMNANGGPTAPVAGPALTYNDVAMVAWDRDIGSVWYGKNGVWTRDPLTQTGNIINMPADWYVAQQNGHYNTACEFRMHDMYCEYGPPAGYKSIGML